MKQTPTIQEFGFLTICAIRYCFGRESVMPSTIVDATKANWELLSEGNKKTILRDVAEALQSRSMGTTYDINMWANFYEWMLTKNNENTEKVGCKQQRNS